MKIYFRMLIVCTVAALIAVLVVSGHENNGLPMAFDPDAQRGTEIGPEMWAKPIPSPDIPNLHQVSPDLYRGGQPNRAGMQFLKSLGIRTVVNLRSFHSDRGEIGNIDINYKHITMKAWHPEEKAIVRFFEIMNDPDNIPVFVHCQHGADRTGLMCAAYRITFQGWLKEEAAREMLEGGFEFHGVWDNLIKYLKRLNFRALARKAGLNKTKH